MDGSVLSIDVDGKNVELTTDKIIVERIEKANLKVLNDGTITVGLDTEITEELKLEGFVRDLIRGIQNLRKESGLEVSDHINLTLSGDDELKKAYEMFADYISGETLADKTDWASKSDDKFTAVESEEKVWSIKLAKV